MFFQRHSRKKKLFYKSTEKVVFAEGLGSKYFAVEKTGDNTVRGRGGGAGVRPLLLVKQLSRTMNDSIETFLFLKSIQYFLFALFFGEELKIFFPFLRFGVF